jgi:hypothetical protein
LFPWDDAAAADPVAWALGLGEDSPLIPVTDVLLTAPHRGLDPGTALGHLQRHDHRHPADGR